VSHDVAEEEARCFIAMRNCPTEVRMGSRCRKRESIAAFVASVETERKFHDGC
jgi:hypothetical protein